MYCCLRLPSGLVGRHLDNVLWSDSGGRMRPDRRVIYEHSIQRGSVGGVEYIQEVMTTYIRNIDCVGRPTQLQGEHLVRVLSSRQTTVKLACSY